MSEGSVFRRKSDGRWVAKWKDAQGKWCYLYRRTKAEAKAALRQALQARDEGIVPVGKLTLNDLIDSWLEDIEGVVSRRTMVLRKSIHKVHIKDTIGPQRLSRLSHKDFQRLYKAKIEGGLKPATVKCIHALLKQAFADAVKRKYISHNPLSDVRPPRDNKEEAKQILSPSQVKHLLASIVGHRFELAVYMGACCGLRVGETMSLKVSDFDLTRGTVTINRTLWDGETWSTKTTGSRKTLKLPEIAREAVQRRMTSGDGDSEWLFPTKNDRPVAPCNFHYPFKAMLREARLPNITFHSLRAQVGSTLLSRGLPLPNVSLYLRHSNTDTTARYYSFILAGSEDAASDGISDALS